MKLLKCEDCKTLFKSSAPDNRFCDVCSVERIYFNNEKKNKENEKLFKRSINDWNKMAKKSRLKILEAHKNAS